LTSIRDALRELGRSEGEDVMLVQGDGYVVGDGFGAVADAFYRTIADPLGSGATLSIWLDGAPVVELWSGVADPGTGDPVVAETLFRIFSCTKGVASVLIGMLVERGAIPSLETPVADIWPEFAAHGKDRVTIGDALAHRAGLSAPRRQLSQQDRFDDLAIAEVLAAQEPLWKPGEHHQYHTITHGAITSKLVMIGTGRPLSQVLAQEVAAPLSADMWLGLPASQEPRLSRLIDDPQPAPGPHGDPESIAWVERAATLNGSFAVFNVGDPALTRATLAGSSGAATATGLARIWSATVTETMGIRLVDDTTVERLRQPRSVGRPRFSDSDGPWQSWGAGVMIPSDWQQYLSDASLGHDGAGGQVAFADSDARLGFAYLTNQMGTGERGASIVRALSRALG
jgi:CubicO group peptidase (beta-lactamase class C family)